MSAPTGPDLYAHLGSAVAMACKQDQVSWSIFGVFSAANTVLLVALFAGGTTPPPSVGIVVSLSGIAFSFVWFLIQGRSLAWLGYYHAVIMAVEKDLGLPSRFALSSDLNLHEKEMVDRRSKKVRPLMQYTPYVVSLVWIGSLIRFAT